MNIRFVSLLSLFSVLFGLLSFNLFHLQIQKGEYYIRRAEARNEARAALSLRRGRFFFTDRSEESIAVALNRNYPVIYAVPKEIENIDETVRTLAPLLHKDEGLLTTILASNPQSNFKLLIEKAAPEEIDVVERAQLRGIYTDEKQYRSYPYEELGAHLIGYVGVNETHPAPAGIYGFEKLYEEKLASGEDIRFTIDRNIQVQAEKILSELISKYGATGGTVIVEEPSTGKILTLANKPSFNPNEYQKSPLSSFLNPAVQYVYEPGSVFKPLTMAAGIETGAITPTTTFTDKGFVTLNGRTIRNALDKVYGTVTMTNVIENSINTGAVFAEREIGHAQFLAFLRRFGFGTKTNVDIPNEVAGSLRNLERKDARAVDFATASFGQGTAVTPLQLISAFSALANGGVLMRPYVNIEESPEMVRRVVSKETTEKVIAMMESAVEKAGVAAIPAYHIAGKTGTALIPDFQKGGYTDELTHTFVGIVPTRDPKAVILVKLDKPQVGELAGITVVPAFRELAQFVINYYQIPPDKLSPKQ